MPKLFFFSANKGHLPSSCRCFFGYLFSPSKGRASNAFPPGATARCSFALSGQGFQLAMAIQPIVAAVRSKQGPFRPRFAYHVCLFQFSTTSGFFKPRENLSFVINSCHGRYRQRRLSG